jgi:acyl carrier protein
VFHLAADMSSRPLAETDAAALAGMLKPKIAGALNLHRLSSAHALDAFVLFSSTTALLGVAGLGHYAAANQFLDGLARSRREHGLPALSVNWGTWETMRVASEAERRQFQEAGLLPMSSESAFDAMARLVASGTAGAVVAHVDWRALRAVYESRRPRPLLSDLGAEPAPAARASGPAAAEIKGGEPDLVRRCRESPAGKRRDLVLATVRDAAARILGLDPAQPMDPTQGLFEMGMDSLMSVELKSRLQACVGRSLPSTLTFNYPNVGALADYLIKEVLSAAEPAAPEAVETPRAVTGVDAPVAELDDLSEDELAAMLATRLSQGGDGKR